MNIYKVELDKSKLEKDLNSMILKYKDIADRNTWSNEFNENTVKTKLNGIIAEYCFNEYAKTLKKNIKWLNEDESNRVWYDFVIKGMIIDKLVDVKWLKLWEKKNIEKFWKNESTIIPVLNLLKFMPNVKIKLKKKWENEIREHYLTKSLLKENWTKDIYNMILSNKNKYLNENEIKKMYLWRVIFECDYKITIDKSTKKVKIDNLSNVKYLIDDYTMQNYYNIIKNNKPTTEQPNNFKRKDINNTLNYKLKQNIL